MRLAVQEYNTFTFADGTHCLQAQECCENLEVNTFIKLNYLAQHFEENKLRIYWLRHRPLKTEEILYFISYWGKALT